MSRAIRSQSGRATCKSLLARVASYPVSLAWACYCLALPIRDSPGDLSPSGPGQLGWSQSSAGRAGLDSIAGSRARPDHPALMGSVDQAYPSPPDSGRVVSSPRVDDLATPRRDHIEP
jgi:hypothetical protein